MEKYKVATVVVTYNRLDCLKKCIQCLKEQTYLSNVIVVIDNASNDGTDKYCEDIKGITYIRLNENRGGSYGFYYGVKYASELGVDLIWGMDDDAYAQSDALEQLVSVYNKEFSIEDTALWSNSHSHKQSYTPGKIEDIRKWTFVGFMLSTSMVKKIGFPMEDLFIFYDDAEYAKRIKKNGFSIKKVHDSIIIHEGAINKSQSEQYFTRKILGITVKVQNLPKWKWYYMVRNIIIIQDSFLYKILAVGLGCKYGFKFLIVKPSYLKIWFKAICDGIRGRKGKIVSP